MEILVGLFAVLVVGVLGYKAGYKKAKNEFQAPSKFGLSENQVPRGGYPDEQED